MVSNQKIKNFPDIRCRLSGLEDWLLIKSIRVQVLDADY